MQRRTALRSLAAGVALAIAGCGDGDDDGNDTDGDTDSPGETTAPGDETTEPGDETTEPGDETTEPGDETTEPGGGGGEAAQTVEVGAGDGFSFDPDEFTISTGDTVMWEWVQGEHNIVPESMPEGSDWQGTDGGEDQTYTDHTHEFTFETPGDYEYYCAVHRDLGMTGTFTVEDSGTGTGETPGGETPGSDTPGGETPGSDTPGGETPGSDTPGSGTEETTSGSDTPSNDSETV